MLQACSIFWSYHPWHNWTKHININFIIFNVPKVREEWIKFWFCWCFLTNRAHALDLYLVFMSRTHFKQSVGELVDSPNFYKDLNLSNQKQNSKPRWIWQNKVTSQLEASSQEFSSSEQTKVLDQWTSQGEVRFEGLTIPNPHRKG